MPKVRKRGVKPSLRRAVWLRAERRCQACGRALRLRSIQAHHVKPLIEQGSDELDNLVCLCVPCHTVTYAGHTLERKWRGLRCGCQVEVFRRGIVLTRRMRRFFKSIGVGLRTKPPSKARQGRPVFLSIGGASPPGRAFRYKMLCRRHGQWGWKIGSSGRREYIRTFTRCKPVVGDMAWRRIRKP